MKLEEKITLLRKRKGWSQEELGFRLDVSRQAVSKWERGASDPNTANLLALAKLYGMEPEELLAEIREQTEG